LVAVAEVLVNQLLLPLLVALEAVEQQVQMLAEQEPLVKVTTVVLVLIVALMALAEAVEPAL
jgi:hypothetical protein